MNHRADSDPHKGLSMGQCGFQKGSSNGSVGEKWEKLGYKAGNTAGAWAVGAPVVPQRLGFQALVYSSW